MFSKSSFDNKIPDFIHYLNDKHCREDYLLYEIQPNWARHWNVEDLHLAETLNLALDSQISHRLWRAQDYDSKEMIMELAKFDREGVRMIFKDLLNDSKPLDLRFQRFIFHCDQLFTEYRKQGSNQKRRSHYQDYPMVSLYLFLNNPERYLLYDEAKYLHAMMAMRARNVSSPVSIDSYFKIGAILGKFLNENPAVQVVLSKKLGERNLGISKSNAIVTIFMEWLYMQRS